MSSLAVLFDSSGFPPRWACGTWSPLHGWIHISADLAIAAAYFAIPIIMAVFVRRRRSIPFPSIFWLFIAFIASCGTCHLIEAVIFWHPVYRLGAFTKVLTALSSGATALTLVRVFPKAMALQSPEMLREEVERRTLELRREKAILEAILDSLSVGVVVRTEGELVLMNESARRLARLSGSSPEGDERTQLFTLTEPQAGPLVSAENKRTSSIDLTTQTKEEDSQALRLATRAVEVPDVFTGSVVVIEDLSEERRRESELISLNRNLERSNEELERFAYVASHDLQEPLRMVTSFSQLLKQRYTDVLDDNGTRYVEFISEGAARMHRLIDDLLLYARVRPPEPGKANPVAVDQALRQAIDSLQSKIDETGAVVEVSGFDDGQMVPAQLTQVFQNLIGNALKFRHPESPPHVEVRATAGSGGSLDVTISDQGIGIDPAHHELIFNLFHRLEPRSGTGGTGIGLAIVKRIVENHGGTIWVKSALGEGTTFGFNLPS